MKNYLLILMVCSMVISTELLAQNYSTWEYLQDENLNFQNIRVLHQDQRGMMWIGTSNGLYRYDGHHLLHYNDFAFNDYYIPATFVHNIIELEENKLLLLASGKLFILNTLNNEVTNLLPFEETNAENRVNGILEISNGKICLEHRKGKYLYLKRWEGATNFVTIDSVLSTKGTDVALENGLNDDFWWSTNSEGVKQYQNQGTLLQTIKPDSVFLYNRNCYFVRFQKDILRKGMWIIPHWLKKTGTKIFFYDFTTHQLINDPYQFPAFVNHAEADQQGNIWFYDTETDVIFKLDKNDRIIDYEKSIYKETGLKQLTAVYEDPQQTLWLGINGKLIKRSNRQLPFQKIAIGEQGEDPFVPWAFFEDSKGFVYVKTEKPQSHLYRIHPQTDAIELFPLKTSSGQPADLPFYNRQYFYDSTEDCAWGMQTPEDDVRKGLARIDLKTQTLTVLDTSIYQFMLPVSSRAVTLTDNRHLIMGGTPQTLIDYDLATKTYERVLKSADVSGVYEDIVDLHIGSSGDIWLAMYNKGVFRIRTHKGVLNYFHAQSNPPLSSNYVNAVYEEKADSLVWVATSYGLNKINLLANKITYYNIVDGLSNETILGILPYQENYLILSTLNGLSIFNKKEETFRNYYQEDGITNNAFRRYSYFVSNSGRYYFGTENGITAFFPDEILEEKTIQKPFLTQVQIYDGKKDSVIVLANQLSENEPLHIASTDIYFQIHYAIPNYLLIHRHQFQTWLEGYENKWIYQGANSYVRYNSLPPGNYTLHIKGADSEGNWSEPIAIPIVISEFWYKTSFAFVVYILLGIFGLYFIFKYWLKRRLEKEENLRLKELNTIRTRFYTNITHEFRTPLTVISGMVMQIKESPEKWLDKGIDMIQRNTNQLLNLVNQLLDLQKLEASQLSLSKMDGDLIAHLRYIMASFETYAAIKNIRLHFLTAVPVLSCSFDAEKVQTIIANLLSNAIKFTPSDGDIYLEIGKTEAMLIIKVRDTGVGMAASELPHIFNRFYQVDSSMTRAGEGTGIGLSLVKELLNLMKAKIEVNSEVGKGTVFTIHFPIVKEEIMPTQKIAKTPAHHALIMHPMETTFENDSNSEDLLIPLAINPDLPQLLIIEDNIDIIQYLNTILSNAYQISIATDGAVGIEKAIENIPDLIISDVMMPKKNGYEVCDFLKNDQRTSHIPIILLTAKVTHQDKMLGLTKGADVYLRKPFSPEELRLRLKKLLELRQKLRLKYTNALTIVSEEESPKEDGEQVFLNQIKHLVLAHLDDTEFKPDNLAQSLDISRSQLHRKLKALTNRSTSVYMRSIRLQEAKRQLQTSQKTIAEIAYATGFNTPQYFTKCFIEEFGERPSEVREES